jgi:hypothetical protein
MAAFLLVGLLPAAAFAESSEKLTRYLPSTSQMVAGLNVTKLSKSKYYKEALKWVDANASDEQAMKFIEEADLDLSTDIDAVAISMPKTSVDSSAPTRTFTMAMSGSFDNEKLLTALKKGAKLKEVKKKKTVVYATDDLEIGFPAKGVVWVTSGPDKYRSQAFEAMSSQKKSVRADKLFKDLMSDVDTSRGFWLVGDTSKMKTPQSAQSPQPQSIGLSIDITKGLDLSVFAEMPSKDDAKKAVGQVEAIKQQNGQAAMLSLFGAAPLVANLKAKQDGTKLRASTNMTASEFDILVQRVRQMVKTQLQGGGAMPSQAVPGKNKAGQNKAGSSPSDGADADFN